MTHTLHSDTQPASCRDYTLRPATPADADYIAAEWQRYFGGGVTAENNTISAAVGDNRYTWGVVAVADNRLVGVGIAANFPRRQFEHDILPAPAVRDVTAPDNGYLYFAAVDPLYRGRGIGTSLIEARVRRLQQSAPTDRAFALAWERDHHPGSSRLFRRLDWSEIATVPRYYERFDNREHCPDCGTDCTCDGVIFARDL